jgi:prepilin signal peptidase PulO-like enzyme (type II secretory pathway)
MELFFIISTFALGAIIGSFLNVTILRHNTGLGFGGRSFCMSCAKQLEWHELIPIISFLGQKGKCSKCQSRISWLYPLGEFLTGLMFTFIFMSFPHESLADYILIIYFWSMFSILLMISVYDIRLKIIPNAPVYTFIALSILAPILFTGGVDLQIGLNILSGLLLSAPFALLWILSNGRLMGLGDAKIVLGLGIMLGLAQGLAAILLAFWIGAIVGVILLLIKKSGFNMKSEIPFGPFLVLSAFLTLVFHFDLNSIANLFQSMIN